MKAELLSRFSPDVTVKLRQIFYNKIKNGRSVHKQTFVMWKFNNFFRLREQLNFIIENLLIRQLNKVLAFCQ